MNNSVILQVDESTKELMEEIQSGISASIEDGMRKVKEKVESVDDNTDLIIKKFKHFDGLSSTVEQLRSLAEDSKKFTEIVTPLDNRVSEINQHNLAQAQVLAKVSSSIESLRKDILAYSDKQCNLALELKGGAQSILTKIEDNSSEGKKLIHDVLDKLSQAESARKEISDRLNSSLTDIKSSVEDIWKQFDEKQNKLNDDLLNVSEALSKFSVEYTENESAHQTFETNTSAQIKDISTSLEKVQATLDIIVNLVTPFWKKMKK